MFETRVLGSLTQKETEEVMREMGCDERGVEIMGPKSQLFVIYAKGLDPRGANIVKQEFLSSGGEVAVPWGALELTDDENDILIFATVDQYQKVKKKLKEQPFDLPVLADEIEKALNNYVEKTPSVFGKQECQIMGVLNVTPDSFYDGGEYSRVEDAVERGIELAEEGADIIDIGGESTRPGSERISAEQELENILPVIEELAPVIDVPISVDTYKPEVAEKVVNAGAEMINDVFGLKKEGMAETIADLDVPVVVMHMQGTPKNMQDNPEYEDVVSDICSYFHQKIEYAVEKGIKKDNIIIDPGIGFGKKQEHNLEIINRLDEFRSLGQPILLGASRKSFLGRILDKEAEKRLYGSLGIAAYGIEKGVSILRVHDVEETVDVAKTIEAVDDNPLVSMQRRSKKC